MTSRYESALHTSAQVKIGGAVQSVSTQIDQAMDSYRTSRGIPNVDANGELVRNVSAIQSKIDQMFGQIAPGTAEKLKDKVVTDAVYAAMDYSPDLAEKILNMGNIEGRTRHSIENQIKQARDAKNVADVVVFEEVRKNWLASAEAGKVQDKIPLGQYQSIYSRDEAIAQKAKDDAIIDIYSGVNSFLGNVSPLNANEQIRALNKLQASIGSDMKTAFRDSEVAKRVAIQVARNIELQEKDPVSYLLQHNPSVKRIRSQISSLDEKSAEYQQAKQTLFDLTLKYQGPPPGHDTLDKSDDSRMYLNLSRNEVRLMSQSEAEGVAAQINQGSPKEALKQINQVLQQYPEQYQPIAFKDLVRLPGNRGIRGEFWAAALNKNAPWVDDYLGVLQNAEAVKKTSTEKLGDFESAIAGNATWLQFANPIASDNFQRQGMVEDFRSGVLLYAMGLAQRQGLSPKKAVDLATSRLLNEELGIASANGKPIMVPRSQGAGQPYRTDEQIKGIGRRLELVADNFIDPKELKLTDEFGRQLFPSLSMAGNESTKMSALRDAIRENGTWQTTPDGRAAVLYYDDGQNHFELRDKDNRALVVNFDDLPLFPVEPIVRGALGFNLGSKVTGLERDPLAPIISEVGRTEANTNFPGYAQLGSLQKMVVAGSYKTIYATNWPSMPSWIRREERK